MRLPAPVLLIIATVLWGGNFVVGRAVHLDIAPLSLAFWRWLLAGLILAPFVARDLWAHRQLIRRHFGLLLVLALSGMALFHSFTYIALTTTTAINAAVVLATMPLVIPVASYMAGGERLSRRQALGIAISIVGVAIVISRGDVNVLLGLSFTPGDLWVLAAVVAWSVYSVLLKRLPGDLPPLVMLGCINWLAIAMLFPVFLWEFNQVGGFVTNAPNLLAIAYVAVFASIVAFLSWNAAVAEIGANRAGLFIHLIPLSAALLAIIFLGERLQMYHVVGLAPIVLGIVLTTRQPSAMRKNQ